MLYNIVIKQGDEKTAHSIFFPDIENLVSACDDLDDVLHTATECIDLHFSGLVEDGEEIPLPKSIKHYQNNPEYAGCTWAWIDIDLSKYDNRTQKVNVTLPQFLINKIDDKVNAHKALYKSRSNYLAMLAQRDLSNHA